MASDSVVGGNGNPRPEGEENENSKIEKDNVPNGETDRPSTKTVKKRTKREAGREKEKTNGENEIADDKAQDDQPTERTKPKENHNLNKLSPTDSPGKVSGTKPPETEEKDVGTASFKKICGPTVVLLVVAFLLIIVAISLAPPEPGPEIYKDFDFPKIFERKLLEFQSSFTNQTDRFWRILRNRGLSHLRNANPPQPLVLLLAAPPPAHSVVDCLARKLAEVLDPKHKRMLAAIDGTEEKSFPGEKAKKNMDDFLIQRFKAGHRAALVHHLELLPPPSPLLFYSYCDDQNAPHKHVAIIFTVHLPTEPDASLSPKEAEGTVEKYLSHEVWAKEDQDAVAALLSRVADTVALMNGDPAGSAAC